MSAVTLVGHARARRDPERGEPGAGAREQRVDVAVVAAGELEDPVAVGDAAREADRAHRRLRAGRDEPHQLDRRHRVDDLLAASSTSASVGAPKRRAAPQRRLDRLERLGIGVPEDERAPATSPSRRSGCRRRPRWSSRSPLRMKTGSSRPTARIARTGELTPPGISCSARRASSVRCRQSQVVRRAPSSSTRGRDRRRRA